MSLRHLWQRLREGGGLMVGIPDYDRYLEHRRATHPGRPVLSREAFVHNRMLARYSGRANGKCPC